MQVILLVLGFSQENTSPQEERTALEGGNFVARMCRRAQHAGRRQAIFYVMLSF